MPEYIYENPENEGEFVEVFQTMLEEHVFFKDGKQWRRVYTVPNATIDGKIDPFSKRDFVEKTGRKKDSVGALMDRARDAHLERVQKDGKDPIKEKFLKDYKSANGIEHVLKEREKVINKNGIKVEL